MKEMLGCVEGSPTGSRLPDEGNMLLLSIANSCQFVAVGCVSHRKFVSGWKFSHDAALEKRARQNDHSFPSPTTPDLPGNKL